MTSIHDNRVYAYEVDCEAQLITLHTQTEDRSAYLDVVFSGVVAHHFETVLSGNILFGIDEVEPERIVTAWSELFAAQKDCGWPFDYRDHEHLASTLRSSNVRGFKIGSSYGMTGWVLANRMEVRARADRATALHA